MDLPKSKPGMCDAGLLYNMFISLMNMERLRLGRPVGEILIEEGVHLPLEVFPALAIIRAIDAARLGPLDLGQDVRKLPLGLP